MVELPTLVMMRMPFLKNIIGILSILLSTPLFSQKDTSALFDEYGVSFNQTYFPEEYEGKTGGGFGIYKNFPMKDHFSMLFGFEYNYFRIYDPIVSYLHTVYYTEVTYHLHGISIPVKTKFSFGNKIKWISEAGLFMDINPVSFGKGIEHISVPPFSVSKVTFGGNFHFNYGPTFGTGIQFPLLNKEFILRTEYRWWIPLLEWNQGILDSGNLRIALSVKIE